MKNSDRTANGLAALFLFLCALIVAPYARADVGASVTLASGAPSAIYPGEQTSLEITLSNSDTAGAATGVAFSNALPGVMPDGLLIMGAGSYTCTDPSGPTTSAGTGTLTVTPGTQAISLSGGSIPARSGTTDGTCTITLPVSAA